jgi:hypothetical protein
MEECRMRSFRNWVVRIFGPKMEEVTLTRWSCVMRYFTSHTSPHILRQSSKESRLAGNVACMVAKINSDGILVRKPEGKRPLGSFNMH